MASVQSQHKTCGRCEKNLPAYAFPKASNKPDGLQSWCRTCFRDQRSARRRDDPEAARKRERIREKRARAKPGHLERRRNYYQDNRDHIASRRSELYRKDPEKYRAKRRDWYWENHEKALDKAAAWRAENPEKLAAYNKQARAYRNAVGAESNRSINKLTQAFARNAKLRWSEEEDKLLLDSKGSSIYEIAIQLGRSYAACVSRRQRLRKELTNATQKLPVMG